MNTLLALDPGAALRWRAAGRWAPALATCKRLDLPLWRRAEMQPAPLPPSQPGLAEAQALPAPGMALPEAEARSRQARDARLASWLQQAAAGDAQAFEHFYDATIAYAQCLARRLLRGADVDDVLADTYFQAWREAARFDPARGSAVTWLLTRLRCRAIDLLRARRPEAGAALADGDAEAIAAQLPSPLPGPDELLALAEAGSRLHAALAALSAHERWVLGLAYFQELSHAAIASATGLPLGTVKSLSARAQAKLRTQLAR